MTSYQFKAAIFLAALLTSCTRETDHEPAAPALITIEDVAFDGDGAGMPWLTPLAGGGVVMSWIRTEADTPRLEFSRYEGGSWSGTGVIATQVYDEEWFVNWADFPSVIELGDGSLASHFLVSAGDHIFAYDVHITRSDGGGNWMPTVLPHTDGTETEHGFVSLLPWQENEVLAVWLDGRNTAGSGHGHGGGTMGGAMTLRSAILGQDGLHSEAELDGMVCDCCQTAAVLLPDGGALAAYRGRTTDEIRDISVVRFRNGKWEEPRLLHNDGWEIYGCPVNGPALDASGETVAAVWFTHAGDTARVKAAFSRDGGDTWSDPVIVDDAHPLGRVDIVMIDEQRALLSWINQESRDARIMVRIIHRDGRSEPAVEVTTSPELSGRASGFPRMAAYSGNEVLIAWTSAEEGRRHVQIRKIKVSD